MQRISIALLLSIILTSTPSAALATTFADVQGTLYQPAFTYLADKNIVQGYSDGSGKPNALINRVEVVKVLVSAQSTMQTRLQWFQRNVPPIPLFLDIEQTQWYIPFLETAFEQQMVTGYPDGSFKPANSVTVEEALALILRAYKVPLDKSFKQSSVIQNANDQWYTPYINTAIARNLIHSKEKLYLGAPMSRGAVFDVLYRLDSITTTGQTAFIEPASSSTVAVAQATSSTNQNTTTPSPTYSSTSNYPTPTTSTANSQYLSRLPFAITIPSVGIYDLPINRPTDYSPEGLLQPLQNGVGHLFSFPGGGGKMMVYGHSSGYPWDTSEYTKIFRKINEAKPGDKIYVTYNGQVFTYQVTYEETVPANDTSRFNDNGEGEKLILYTCWPPDSIDQRYLVHAVPST